MRGLNLALGVALLAGCTHWSEYGQGGAAEELPQSAMTDQEELQEAEMTSREEAEAAVHDELQQDFNHSRQHLEVLVLRGAQRCFPASVHTARLQRNRVARELEGGLIADAETSLLDLRIELHRLEQKIESMKHADYCWQKDQESGSEMLKLSESSTPRESAYPANVGFENLHRLLNSDNQFAFGSHRINPKYQHNLASACKTLQQAGDVAITVTGHTDASGDDSYNRHLSSQRAMAVVDFLTACGIEASRIELAFAGDSQPFYAGRSPEVDLVNRRVQIQLKSDPQQVSQ
jgi:outer membrane protein OmpA-like peptidoglycan-associated protein